MSSAFDAPGVLAPATIPDAFIVPQSIATYRMSDRGYITRETDTPAHTLYPARVDGDFEISQSVSDALSVGGRVALTASEVRLRNEDGVFDSMIRDSSAVGREIRIMTVPVLRQTPSDCGSPLAAAQMLFRGTIAGWSRLGFVAGLSMSDITEQLNTPLRSQRYDGLGGTGGPAELKGRPKPLSFGYRFNATPTSIGTIDLGAGVLPTYQWHPTTIQGTIKVRERGIEHTEVTSGTPTAGQWRDFPASGCFQLGFTPNGLITGDLQGHVSPTYGYVSTTAAILKAALIEFGPSFVAAMFDTRSWEDADLALPGEIGWGIGTDEISTTAFCDEVLSGCAAFLSGSRSGGLRLTALGSPIPTPAFNLETADCIEVEPMLLPADIAPAPQQVDVDFARNWTPMTDISSSVTGAARDALAGEGGVARAFSAAIASRSAHERTLIKHGLYRLEADAQDRADTLLAWLERGLKAYRVATYRYLGQMELGLTGQVVFPEFGIGAGWSGTVVAWRESGPRRRVQVHLIG